MRRRSRIVLGSLTGLVAAPTIVGLATVLVRDLRGPVFAAQGVPALVVCGVVGIVVGGLIAGRMEVATRRGNITFGAIAGSVLGAAAMGTAFLAAEVAGEDWPHGLQAFLTGAVVGAVVGGSLGGGFGSLSRTERRYPVSVSSGASAPTTSPRDAR